MEVNGTFVIPLWTAVGWKYIPPFKLVNYFFFENKGDLSKFTSEDSMNSLTLNISPLTAVILALSEDKRAELAESVEIGAYIGIPYLV